jgi:hypothetical protein
MQDSGESACALTDIDWQLIWGSFRLTAEPVHFPPIQLKKELAEAELGDRLLHLNHGETLYYS